MHCWAYVLLQDLQKTREQINTFVGDTYPDVRDFSARKLADSMSRAKCIALTACMSLLVPPLSV